MILESTKIYKIIYHQIFVGTDNCYAGYSPAITIGFCYQVFYSIRPAWAAEADCFMRSAFRGGLAETRDQATINVLLSFNLSMHKL